MGTMITSQNFMLAFFRPATDGSNLNDGIFVSSTFENDREEILRHIRLVPPKESEIEDLLEISRYIQPRVFQAV